MNPFPLNRLARVHRVHVRDFSTPKNGPHGAVTSPLRLRSQSTSLTDGKTIAQRRAVPQGIP